MKNNMIIWINNYIDKEKKEGKRFIEKISEEDEELKSSSK